MTEQIGTGRKDTGRTDKYSDESPEKDFSDFRQDSPAAVEKQARIDSRAITNGAPKRFLGIPGLKAATQYLHTTSENFRETFTPKEKEAWSRKMNAAIKLFDLIQHAVPGRVNSDFRSEVDKCLDILK